MAIRKTKLIDKKFQLRTLFSVTFIAMLFFIGVVIAVSYFSLSSRKNVTMEIGRLEKAIETEDNIVTAFVEYAKRAAPNPVRLSVETVRKDHEQSMNAVREHIATLERHTDSFFYLLLIAIFMMIALVVVYYFYIMRLTHRISGPIYVMSRRIQEMIDGKAPEFRDLRDKDEFKDLYRKIIELGEKIRERGSLQ